LTIKLTQHVVVRWCVPTKSGARKRRLQSKFAFLRQQYWRMLLEQNLRITRRPEGSERRAIASLIQLSKSFFPRARRGVPTRSGR